MTTERGYDDENHKTRFPGMPHRTAQKCAAKKSLTPFRSTKISRNSAHLCAVWVSLVICACQARRGPIVSRRCIIARARSQTHIPVENVQSNERGSNK